MDLEGASLSSYSSSVSGGPGQTTDNHGPVKYKGVRLRKWGSFVSEIRLPNSRERIWLGSHDTAEKAARAFDAAQFCLRGPRAKFNFPDDPPNIPGRESLGPSEIQAAALQYANENSGRTKGDESRARPIDLVDNDWSFLDKLDGNGGGGDYNYNNGYYTGCDSDFGVFPEPSTAMYMLQEQDYVPVDNDDYGEYDFDPQNSTYSLWNF